MTVFAPVTEVETAIAELPRRPDLAAYAAREAIIGPLTVWRALPVNDLRFGLAMMGRGRQFDPDQVHHIVQSFGDFLLFTEGPKRPELPTACNK